MAKSWFIKTRNGERGPFTARAVKLMVTDGRVKPDTLVRLEDSLKWSRAAKLAGLFPSAELATDPQVADRIEPEPGVVESFDPNLFRFQEPSLATDDTQDEQSPVAAPPRQPDRLSWWLRIPPKVPSRFASNRGLVIGIAVAVSLIAGVLFFLSGDKTLTTEQLVANAEPAVAFIKGRSSSGTGFLISKGVLATNRHVVDGEFMRHVEVYFPSASEESRGPFTVDLLYLADEIDLALLQINAPIEPLRCASEYTFRRGQEIVVIGNPGVSSDVTLQNAVSRGVMSTQTVIDGRQYNQLGISINAGNSGGPVFDDSGLVIGVVTLKATEQEGLGFAIPIQAVNLSLAKSQKCTPDEIAKTRAIHRARFVYKYVSLNAEFYKLSMDIFGNAIHAALDSGMNPDDGVRLVRAKMEDQLTEFNRLIIPEAKQEISEFFVDPQIPESTRQRMVDFWTNSQELKSYVENPRGSYNTYRAKYAELSDKHDRLNEALKLLLQIHE